MIILLSVGGLQYVMTAFGTRSLSVLLNFKIFLNLVAHVMRLLELCLCLLSLWSLFSSGDWLYIFRSGIEISYLIHCSVYHRWIEVRFEALFSKAFQTFLTVFLRLIKSS